jgi:transcriptional regulator with XRE-family HTH domain
MRSSAPQPQAIRPLRMVREAQGLSLRETARRAGLDSSHLGHVERGEEGLSIEALIRLAKVLGLHDLARMLWPYAPAPRNARARKLPGNGTRAKGTNNGDIYFDF